MAVVVVVVGVVVVAFEGDASVIMPTQVSNTAKQK